MKRQLQYCLAVSVLIICVTLFPDTLFAQQVNAAYEAQIANLPKPVQMVPTEDLSSWRAIHAGEYGGFEVVNVQNMPFQKALRIHSKQFSRDSYMVQLTQKAIVDAIAGDVMLLTFYGRVIDSSNESGEGSVKLFFRRNKPPFGGSGGRAPRDVGLQSQWKKFYYPFELDLGRGIKQASAQEMGIVINACYNKHQTIEIADVQVLKFPASVKFADLPESVDTYPGRELDAPWRADAAKRIKTFRKGDLSIQVVDGDSQPIANAQVEVEMTKHAFDFGCALNAVYWETLMKKPQNAQQFNRLFTQYFTLGSHIGSLKWQQWEEDRVRAIDSVDWMLANGMKVRGHNLVWPRWDKTPFAQDKAKQKYFTEHPEALQQTILDHIRDEVGAFKGKVIEWDVYNEPWSHYQLAELVGYDKVAQWFKVAHEVDPNARLILNEGGKLSRADLQEEAHQNFLKLIQTLRKYNAPISGVGFEAHFRWGCPDPMKVLEVLDYYKNQVGLPVSITEFDHRIDDEQLQADWERDFLTLCFSHPNVTSFARWGWWNGISQGGFLNKDWSKKPNGEVFEQLVFKDWWTTSKGQTASNGQYKLRGFFGDYFVKITHDGKTWRYPMNLTKDNGTLLATLTDAEKQKLDAAYKRERQERKQAIATVEQRVTQRLLQTEKATEQKTQAVESATSGDARINLGSRNSKIKLQLIEQSKKTKASYATWLPANQQQAIIIAQCPAPDDQWQEMSVTFKAISDGQVPLTLAGEFVKKGDPVWVYYDDVTVTGATLANGDFEQVDGKNPSAWQLKKSRKLEAQYVDLAGNKVVLVSNGATASQMLTVTGGQAVTVTAKIKLYKP